MVMRLDFLDVLSLLPPFERVISSWEPPRGFSDSLAMRYLHELSIPFMLFMHSSLEHEDHQSSESSWHVSSLARLSAIACCPWLIANGEVLPEVR